MLSDPHQQRNTSSNGAKLESDGTLPTTSYRLAEYSLSLDLEVLHPARLFILRSALFEHLQQARAEEVTLLQKAFYRTLPMAKRLIPKMIESIRNCDYSKQELLEALHFHFATQRSIEAFFSLVISPELYNSTASHQIRQPDIPAHCFDFVSFCPRSIIAALAERRGAEIKSFHDLGCGPGSIMFVVGLLTDATIHGTELSLEWSEKGRAFAESISRPDITFIRADLEDESYSFNGSQVYYCYSPFIFKVEETYKFVDKLSKAVCPKIGELWLGDYLTLRELVTEATNLVEVARYDRLAIHQHNPDRGRVQ